MADSPITQFASSSLDVPVLTPASLKDTAFEDKLREFNADLFVVVAFKILPKSIFSIPPLGTVNIHASLLPKFRGPAPIQRAIENGEKETGVTIFRIDEGIDTGEIILQKRVEIGNTETTPELYQRLSLCGADALIDALSILESGHFEPLQQNHEIASKAPKLSKDEAKINWNLNSMEIFNKIRAFKPFPGTFTVLDNKRLGIQWAEPIFDNSQGDPGKIIAVAKDSFTVQCGSGKLRILSVKPEGKKEMDVHAFLLGTNTIRPGNSFGI